MKKIINKFIKNKKGNATYTSLTISIYIVLILFIGIIFIIPVFHRQQLLDTFAKTIVRQAEIDGTVDQTSTYNYLCAKYNITPIINWEWDKYKSSKKVQLNDKIEVTLTDVYVYPIGGILKSLTIPLTAKATGKSEVYWK